MLGLQQVQIVRERVVIDDAAAVALERIVVSVVAHVDVIEDGILEGHPTVIADERPLTLHVAHSRVRQHAGLKHYVGLKKSRNIRLSLYVCCKKMPVLTETL